jgi:NADPH-dependent ferric siderophore reductase
MSLATPGSHPVRVSALVIQRIEQISPRMRRLVLTGDDLANFESHVPDEHVRIVFPDAGGGVRPPSVVNGRFEWPRPFPPNREYTVRRFEREAGELWIDFAIHPRGLASDWVQAAEPGERVWLAGPKPGIVVPASFVRLVMLGDHTALPAIARWLEELPATAEALVAVQVPAKSERLPLARSVQWLVGDDSDALGEALERWSPENDGATYLWAAGEASVLKPVRNWARRNGFARGTCDIAGYWRRGTSGG